MGCSNATALNGLSFGCSDKPTGGLKKIYYMHLSDIVSYNVTGGIIDSIEISNDSVKELQFNNKDAFTNFTDSATMSAEGISSVVPVVDIEFPKTTLIKRNELNNIVTAPSELVVWIETATGKYHCAGIDYGMYASEVNGKSGNGRSEKNVYTLKLNGDEDELALLVSDDVWTIITNSNLGSNLVTNGTFDGNSSTGWTLGSNWTVSSNRLNFTGYVGTASTIFSGIVTDTDYIVTFDVSGLTGSENMYIPLPTAAGNVFIYENGFHAIKFTSTSAGLGFYVEISLESGTGWIDNITFKKVL